MSEKTPPSLPKRSQVSISSAKSGNQSCMSSTENTSPATSRSLASPIISRNMSEESPSNTAQPSRLGCSLDEKHLASKLDAIALSPNTSKCLLTGAKVRTFLEDCFEDYDSIGDNGFDAWSFFFNQYYSPDCTYVRPSGNPIDSLGLARLFSSDVEVVEIRLVSIDSIAIMESRRSAVVLYTTDQVFFYKGVLNNDRAIISCVMEYRGDELKIIHEHRTNGIPIPKETRWS